MATCDDGTTETSSVFDIVLASLVLVLVIVIVFSNTMVLVLYCWDKRLRVASNLFICMMVIADLLVGVILLPSVVVRLDPCLGRNPTLCAFKYALACLFVTLSLHFQTAIACDRWVAIKRPLRYSNIVTIRTAGIASLLIWLVCIGVFFILPVVWRNHPDTCHIWLIFRQEYVLYVALPICILLCSVTMFCYISLFCTARRLTRQVQVTPQCQVNLPQNTDNDMKAAKTLALVVFLNICTWLPFLTILIVMVVDSNEEPSDTLIMTATVLIFLPTANSAWNPWVYAMKLPAYRQATKHMLRKCSQCCRCNDAGATGTDTGTGCAVETIA